MNMNTTAEILRDCAYGLPDAEDSDTCLLEEGTVRTPSPHICDHLDRMREEGVWSDAGVEAAALFLFLLGMNGGLSEFLTEEEKHQRYYFNDYLKYSIEHQTMRAVFLLFAADLAEEWNV